MIKKYEKALKAHVVRSMGRRWSYQFHEDKHSDGVPDISYGVNGVNGWIEAKYINNWPVRDTTRVKPSRFTPLQVHWLVNRQTHGGHCFVMVAVGHEIFFFPASKAAAIRDGMTRVEYYKQSGLYFISTIDTDRLVEYLSSPLHAPSLASRCE